jgi:uncharacterized protein
MAEQATLEKKPFTASSADDILNKVNQALSDKKEEMAKEDEDDVLELTDLASEGQALPESSATTQISTETTNQSSHIKKGDKIMKDKLVSDNTAEVTVALFNQLKTTAKSKHHSESLKFRSGTTVEEMIAELIAPHLSEWLDKNLASIVKVCVEKEVKKLIPAEE